LGAALRLASAVGSGPTDASTPVAGVAEVEVEGWVMVVEVEAFGPSPTDSAPGVTVTLDLAKLSASTLEPLTAPLAPLGAPAGGVITWAWATEPSARLAAATRVSLRIIGSPPWRPSFSDAFIG
jgi:hypothetical protein